MNCHFINGNDICIRSESAFECWNVNISMQIMDIIEVDENSKTITLYLYMTQTWKTTVYSVNSPISFLIEVPHSFYDEIRRPR